MAYLTIARISGDPDRLLDGYEQTADVMADVGRDHGVIVHARRTRTFVTCVGEGRLRPRGR